MSGRAMGIDPSLSAAGVATAQGAWVIRSAAIGAVRLAHIRDVIVSQLDGIDLVCIEGYAHGAQYSLAAMGEVGGVIRLALHDAGVPYVDVAPNTLKMFATGAGKGGKTGVVVAARERLGYDGLDDNKADALWLHALAADLLGEPVVTLPQAHMRAADRLRERMA